MPRCDAERIASTLLMVLGLAGMEALAQNPLPPELEGASAACVRRMEEAEALLKNDRYEDALDLAGAAAEQCPENAQAHVVKADALYRRGDFEEAERHYRRAGELDPDLAAAHFGVGRILRTLGRYGEAAASFGRASALAPDVPKYLRTLANHLARRQDTLDMLHRYIELVKKEADNENVAGLRNVEAWVALLETLGDRPLQAMVKKEPSSIPLRVHQRQVFVKMTVAGVKNQRFVFDTGATGFTISPRLAKRAKLKPIHPYTIAGIGGGHTETGAMVLIDEIALGKGIVVHNLPATVRTPIGPEAGLVPASIFSGLVMTIDLKGGTLRFEPRGISHAGTTLPFRNVGGEIIIKTMVNDVAFNTMLDTGAAATIINRTTVRRLPDLDALPGQWFSGFPVGVGGPLADRKVILSGTLTVAGQRFPADGLISGNLDGFSRALESEIYVILGVPHLDEFILTIDYSKMTVTFAFRKDDNP